MVMDSEDGYGECRWLWRVKMVIERVQMVWRMKMVMESADGYGECGWLWRVRMVMDSEDSMENEDGYGE
jgi:hypothetical protein